MNMTVDLEGGSLWQRRLRAASPPARFVRLLAVLKMSRRSLNAKHTHESNACLPLVFYCISSFCLLISAQAFICCRSCRHHHLSDVYRHVVFIQQAVLANNKDDRGARSVSPMRQLTRHPPAALIAYIYSPSKSLLQYGGDSNFLLGEQLEMTRLGLEMRLEWMLYTGKWMTSYNSSTAYSFTEVLLWMNDVIHS